ncbi:glycosyltransferase family 4 protein [Almyronema epifaneia]|uniref:Glycosyltransferase family 4 protein n=1 Tax=Almyronema epifaneia S1 TaxID=2991925 RepID=A0ABW6IH67_9CYAN
MPNSSVSPSSPHYVFAFLEIFECEGGIQSYIQDILSAYLALPQMPAATVFLLRDGPNCPNPFSHSKLDFRYLKTFPAVLGRVRLAIALALYLLWQRPQRVFCGHIRLAPLVGWLCQRLNIPYTVLTYGKEVWSSLPPPDQQALQAADRIWTISRYSRDMACQANQLDPTRVDMLPCVVNGQTFTPGSKSSELLEKYQLTGHRVLMTVARLWSGDIYKGVDITIRALPKIAQAFPTVKYLVIGRGDDQPRLARLATELGVADRVVFAGFVPTEALVDHYRLADVYVMPSQEGFGIVYLEAMACGVPTLSGDSDGSADPLQDGRLGWRVPHRDEAAVATACIEILKGNDRRCDGTWLRQETLAKFSQTALVERLQTLLAV